LNPWGVFDENLRIESLYHPLLIIIRPYYNTMHSPRENYTSSVKNVSKNSSSVKVNNDEKNVSKKANETAEFRLLTFSCFKQENG